MLQELSSELHILNKHLKKLFPFILEVSDFVINEHRNRKVIYLDVYVSPPHFCELLDERIHKRVSWSIETKISSMLVALFSDSSLQIRFFPSVSEKIDILEYLP